VKRLVFGVILEKRFGLPSAQSFDVVVARVAIARVWL
jgi:hypothetical protein